MAGLGESSSGQFCPSEPLTFLQSIPGTPLPQYHSSTLSMLGGHNPSACPTFFRCPCPRYKQAISRENEIHRARDYCTSFCKEKNGNGPNVWSPLESWVPRQMARESKDDTGRCIAQPIGLQ